MGLLIMRCSLGNKGSLVAVSAMVILFLVSGFIELGRVYYATVNILEEQNRKDAHMLSIIGLYVETLDKVSWINKQLQRMAMLCSAAVLVPGLAPIVKVAQRISVGLELYQDLLLLRLKAYAPILDLELRRKNKLSLKLNYHYVEYRRQKGLDLGIIKMPALIEFKRDVFRTACVEHKGLIASTGVCIEHSIYGSQKNEWFAPIEDTWTVRFKDA